MKSILQKLILILFVSLISFSVYAQVPEGFNFQAAARGINGELLTNQALGVKISILKGTESGEAVYSETHSITTNSAGIIQLVIGDGTAAEEQSFNAINFGNDNYFVKLAIDPAGGTEYADLGTTRLLSVPYALVAKNVVNGDGGPGAAITEYNLNTANTDSSFIINIEGDKTAKPFQVFSSSTAYNGAVWGEAVSEVSNEANQRGVLGFANGSGLGNHIGIFGGAVNYEATGEKRVGVYGQAASKAKYNYGMQGIVQGDGNGSVVPLGEEVGNDYGSYNIAGGFYSSGNLNGNVGIEAQTSGSNGSRVDFGVISRAVGTGNSPNIGVRGEAFNSPMQNVAFEGDASGSGTQNLGLRLNVFNGTSNIGMEVNADTAAVFNGHSIVNGDLTVGGTVTASSVNQTSDVRLKKDIQTLDNALGNILKMRGVSYNWKTDESNENPQIGVIAQEVEKIYPEFVHTDESGMKSVNYAQMTAVLIEAVKALNIEIQELKTDNLSLQAKLDTQSDHEQRLSKIEKLLSVESIVKSVEMANTEE